MLDRLQVPMLSAAVALVGVGAACAPGGDAPSDTGPTAEASDDCAPDPSWFPHARTPRPDADAFVGQSQCAFHQFSWQAFLWLTQEGPSGGPRFLSLTTPGELYGQGLGAGLLPRMAKSADPEPIDEFLQAGTDGIMTDLQGHPIYYSQYVDSVFDTFLRSRNLTDTAALYALDDTVTFPNGATSLKASWKRVLDGEDASDFFTMQAEVYELANRAGAIVVDTTRTSTKTLALVGFHIAVRVEGHPEMIWATFEHERNAPNIFSQDNVGDTVLMTDTISTRDFTFYSAGTPRSECNVNYASSQSRSLDPATQTITPITQVCREYQFGNLPPPVSDTGTIARRVSQSDANVDSLNAHVRANLQPSDVWSNYAEVGAIWFVPTDGLRPGQALDTDSLLIGSLRLSNATIETFTQSQSTMNNCFRCHNTLQKAVPLAGGGGARRALPAKNVNISHVLVNGYFRGRGQP